MDLTKADQQPRTPEEKERPKRTRVHRSIYLEQAVYDRLGEAYKATNHEFYPLEVRKSALPMPSTTFQISQSACVELTTTRNLDAFRYS